MDIQESISQLEQFRQELYEAFDLWPDALMELIDASSSTPNARSNGTNGQVAQVPHPPFDVTTILVDAPHPIQVVSERLARLAALVGDEHPATIQLGRFGDPVGATLISILSASSDLVMTCTNEQQRFLKLSRCLANASPHTEKPMLKMNVTH